jgi:hypothetical protein
MIMIMPEGIGGQSCPMLSHPAGMKAPLGLIYYALDSLIRMGY